MTAFTATLVGNEHGYDEFDISGLELSLRSAGTTRLLTTMTVPLVPMVIKTWRSRLPSPTAAAPLPPRRRHADGKIADDFKARNIGLKSLTEPFDTTTAIGTVLFQMIGVPSSSGRS